MSIPYHSLAVSLAPAGTVLLQPSQKLPEHSTPEDSALDAMTDLSRTAPAIVDPELSLERAEQHMKHARVRLLFVMDAEQRLLGLITLNDIKGERPLRFQREWSVPRGEIRVQDIMTPLDRLETLSFAEVRDARIGDVLQTLKRTGRQHALVLERGSSGPAIRGIFSSTRISRQLGVPVETSGIAYTFAELEAALAH